MKQLKMTIKQRRSISNNSAATSTREPIGDDVADESNNIQQLQRTLSLPLSAKNRPSRRSNPDSPLKSPQQQSSTTSTLSTSSKSIKSTRKNQFRARTSRLDTDTMINEKPEFRGFYILFWVVLALFILQSILTNRRQEGVWLRTDLMDLFSRNLQVFGLSHLVMLSATFLCLPIHWLTMRFRWMPLMVCNILKYCLEVVIISCSVWWIFYQDLPWSQSITFLMHSCVMAMKVHSYLTVNAEFEGLYRRFLELTSGNLKSYDSDAVEIAEIQAELTKQTASYPHTATVWNYIDFMLVPTLVYELEYPRTNSVRPLYIVEKIAATFGVVGTLYFMIEHFVYPTLRDLPNESPVESYVKLMIPFMLGWIMLFYVMFEGVCNAFAELTRFADRNFYDDWWNSRSFDEFARKWNKPVHEFLLRHVYLEAIDSYKVSKTNATFLTFFFSSVLHELIAAVVARKFILLFFSMQMSQLPLIWVFRLPFLRQRPLLANTLFWLSLISGFPVIAILYTRDYFLHNESEKN